MFLLTLDLEKFDCHPTITLNKKHYLDNGQIFGIPYIRGLDWITATFSGGYHSSSKGKTHYGNGEKWAICGTSSPIFHIKGKPVNCKKCKNLFKLSFPIHAEYSPYSTDAVPVVATAKARVKYSQRGFFEKVSKHAYRSNNGRWQVSDIHDGRLELKYEGQSLRVMLSPAGYLGDASPIVTYFFPDTKKSVGLTCVTFEQEEIMNGRPLIIPSALCFVTIRTSSKYITMPFDNRAMAHIRVISGRFNNNIAEGLLREWKVYKYNQDTVRMIIRGDLKPVKGHKFANG